MHAEIPILKIVNGLYYRKQFQGMTRIERESIYAEGIRRLSEIIKEVKKHPNVNFSDFGNRRSFNPYWHEFVVQRCAEELGTQFAGTSNVFLASKYGLNPIGTCAHELSMGITALNFDGTEQSIKNALTTFREQWWKKYGHGLSVDLPDTYGTEYTMQSMPETMLRDWKGQRIDSMDPMQAIPYILDQYEKQGIDSRKKLVIPSDGLDLNSMIKIADAFGDRIKVSFGWGTKLTNNLGLQQLSIVMKPYSINGKFCVKLSDNIEKAMGEPSTVEAYKKALGYHETYTKVCEV